MNNQEEKICIINEIGDMGLGLTELDENDKKLYEAQFTDKDNKEQAINE